MASLIILAISGLAGLFALFLLCVGLAGRADPTRAGKLLVLFSIAGCLGALFFDAVPGCLGSAVGWALALLCLASPFLVVGGALRLHRLWRDGRLAGLGFTGGRALLVFLLLSVTCVLLRLDVTRRVAFSASRSAFETLVPQAHETHGAPEGQDRFVGLYRVDAFAADPRGGVYFRVWTQGDLLGMATTSFGFAYRPNRIGSPFGAAQYRTWPLAGDWKTFRASIGMD